MAEVRIVTDSTADLKAEWVQELGITVVPLNVHFGDELFKDKVDLDVDTFFQRLRQADELPRSSQPSPADFEAVYRPLVEAGHPVVSIHISDKLSGTLASARMARELLGKGDIRMVDSRLVSVSLGLVVLEAARAAAAGAGVDEVERAALAAADRVSIYFALDTLEYLLKGGRIGRARAFVGSLLNMKPVLAIEDGLVVPKTRVRGRRRVIPELERLLAESLGESERADIIIIHSEAPDSARELAGALQATGRVGTLHHADIGPVIGVHAGPGALGFAMLRRAG